MARKGLASTEPEGSDSLDVLNPSRAEIEAGEFQDPPEPLYVVGIGASAGGLEALELFLRNLPPTDRAAFVVVQHLDPTHEGVLPELLQRVTPMNVVQATDRTPVRPGVIYVIPPNRDMTIQRGLLYLSEPHLPRGQRLPIDSFFRSLADDQQVLGIGVILSGMGSDGTLGLRAIKERAGATFAQEPGTARFESMPRSAIDAGMVDVVAPPNELPDRILDYVRHEPLLSPLQSTLEPEDHSGLERIAMLLRAKTGHDFSLYKKSTMYRRIERRMGLHQIGKIAAYVNYLRENPIELDLLFKELLIGVTSFFRDPGAWDLLEEEVLPRLLADRSKGKSLRAWVPACSTGEEAYSLAIVFKEVVARLNPESAISLQIFATDLDNDAIDRARTGIFPASIADDVPADRLNQYFTPFEGGFSICKSIREMIVFAPQNVVMNPPFTRLDILSCRNFLIYLTSELQQTLLPLFHYSLNPGGVLFLGSAETVGGFEALFDALNPKFRLYRRRDTVLRGPLADFPTSMTSARAKASRAAASPPPAANLQALADQLLLRHYAPAAVLVNDQGDILYISGRTGKYLEPAAGKANWNIFAMAREGLRYELAGAFRNAIRRGGTVAIKGIRVAGQEPEHSVDLTVQAITEPEALRGLVMVVLSDAPHREAPADLPDCDPGIRVKVSQMEMLLEQARHDARTVREEMQASQEELKSGNEEMQSMNEELQSTNEELTTSKEELQSMNEELQTLNCELQAKIEALSRLNSDMKNLLESTEIATVFLDDAMRVRLYTAGTRTIFKLIPGDIGRPVTDIASELQYPEMAANAREVLRTLHFNEQLVTAIGGDSYRVRIMPYRTVDNKIEGVVITFTNVGVRTMPETR